MEQKANKISKRERDFLVTLEQDSPGNFPIRLYQIAEEMKVKPPTALNVIRRLEEKGFAQSKDGMIILTDSGEKVAKSILFVHRTFESLLCQSGVEENYACTEAAQVDFIIPEEDASLILKKIGNPRFCPHGKPITEESKE